MNLRIGARNLFRLTVANGTRKRNKFRAPSESVVHGPTALPSLEVEVLHEPTECPPGLGLRQFSGAFARVGVPKRQRTAAVQDAHAPSEGPFGFMAAMRDPGIVEALHAPRR